MSCRQLRGPQSEGLQIGAGGVERRRESGGPDPNVRSDVCSSDVFVDQLLERSLSANPTTDSTISPPLKMRIVVMPRMLRSPRGIGVLVDVELPDRDFPVVVGRQRITVGAKRRHGPHHSAQKPRAPLADLTTV